MKRRISILTFVLAAFATLGLLEAKGPTPQLSAQTGPRPQCDPNVPKCIPPTVPTRKPLVKR